MLKFRLQNQILNRPTELLTESSQFWAVQQKRFVSTIRQPVTFWFESNRVSSTALLEKHLWEYCYIQDHNSYLLLSLNLLKYAISPVFLLLCFYTFNADAFSFNQSQNSCVCVSLLICWGPRIVGHTVTLKVHYYILDNVPPTAFFIVSEVCCTLFWTYKQRHCSCP